MDHEALSPERNPADRKPASRNVPPQVARARSSLGRQIQLDAPTEAIQAARAELKAAGLEARIRRDVESWPPLSDAVRAELAVLLLSPGGDHAAT